MSGKRRLALKRFKARGRQRKVYMVKLYCLNLSPKGVIHPDGVETVETPLQTMQLDETAASCT
jgi:hypothetical protein